MRYVVSKDQKSGMWYVHLEGFAYVPVFGSFRKSKREAQSGCLQRLTELKFLYENSQGSQHLKQ